jgi:hypothetical protein
LSLAFHEIEDCYFYSYTFPSWGGPEEHSCSHPLGGGVCCEDSCPRVFHFCPECPEWRQIRQTFGYCVREYRFKTAEEGCVRDNPTVHLAG